MRIFSLSDNDGVFLGIDHGGSMLDLTRAIGAFEIAHNGSYAHPVCDIETLVWEGRLSMPYLDPVMNFVDRHGLAGEFAVADGYAINPPLIPGKIIALGNNYRKHVLEMKQAMPEKPVLFGKWPSTVIGEGDAILKPEWLDLMSYEAELAFIIGTSATCVSKKDAMSHVVGYTCLNDVTARSMQREDLPRSLPWMPSKNYDTFCPMGPCVLVADAVAQPVEIAVKSRVNGETRQDGDTGDFIFDIPTVIEYITNMLTLEPGDVVTTGTPEGVGTLEPGDVVEVECGGIGVLTNPVEAK